MRSTERDTLSEKTAVVRSREICPDSATSENINLVSLGVSIPKRAARRLTAAMRIRSAGIIVPIMYFMKSRIPVFRSGSGL